MANETLERETDELERECIHFPFRVQPVSTRVMSASSLTALAKERAPDASVFDDAQPHLFTGIASTPALDSYFTRMEKSSLENFAADMAEGVPLQNSHDARRLGLGKSLTGRFVRGKSDLPTRTEGEFYFLPDSEIGGVNTDDLMRNIRAGIITDLSVGFYGGRWICDLCGEDYIRGACPHWLGMEYTPEDGGTKQLATAAIHDARLAEVSVVYSGSTPGAAIQKVIRAVDEGVIEPEKVRVLEACYRVKLPGSRHVWAAPEPERGRKETTMPDNDGRAPAENAEWTLPAAERERYRTLVIECGLKPDAPPAAIVEALRSQIASHATERDTAVTERDTAIKERDALKPDAENGVKFRSTLRQQVEENYVRAKGERANVAAKAPAWDAGSIEFLQAEIAEYGAEGDVRFPGGRLTVSGEPEPDPARVNGFIIPAAPASAYRA